MGNNQDILSLFGIEEAENPIFNLERVRDYKRAIELAQNIFGNKARVSYDEPTQPLDPHVITIETKKFGKQTLLDATPILDLADGVDSSPNKAKGTTCLWFGFDLLENSPEILDS